MHVPPQRSVSIATLLPTYCAILLQNRKDEVKTAGQSQSQYAGLRFPAEFAEVET